jgi:transposase-like protein
MPFDTRPRTPGEQHIAAGRHFDRSVILLCIRWYLAYGLSLRDLKEMVAERGIGVDHSTIHRWVVRFSPLLLERFNLLAAKRFFRKALERCRVRPMLGFKSPATASIILDGIEMVHMMRKRQALFAYNPDPSLAEQFEILAAA